MGARSLLASALVAGVCVLPACSGQDDGSNATAPPESPIEPSAADPALVPPDTEATAASTPSGGAGGSDVPLTDRCAGGGQPALAAYALGDGELRWVRCERGLGRRSVVAAGGGVVFLAEQVGDGAGTATPPLLHAVDAVNGEAIWETPVAAIPSGPFLAEGIVVVGTDDVDGPAVAGLASGTGEAVWRIGLDDEAPVAVTDDVVVLWSQFAPADTTPSTGTPGTAYFRGLDRASGAELWRSEAQTTSRGGFAGRPAVDGDTVIVSPGPFALDASSGDVLWQSDAVQGAIGPVADGVAVSGDQFGPVIGIDATTGDVLWMVEGGPAYADVWAVGDGAVYVVDGAASEMIAYELADGSERWRQPWDPERYSWPMHVAGDTMFAMWTNLDAVATGDGAPRWGTDYPATVFPRMTGIQSDEDAVFVAFSNVPSGGD